MGSPDSRIEMPELFELGIKPFGDCTVDCHQNYSDKLVLDLSLINWDKSDLVTETEFVKNGNVTDVDTEQGSALNFPSTDSSISAVIKSLSGTDHTIEIVPAIDVFDTLGVVFFGWNDNGSNFWQIDQTKKYYLGGVYVGTGTKALDDGEFHSFLFTAKANELKVYIDGEIEVSSASTVTLPAGSKTLHIGRWIGGSSWQLEGRLLRVRAWEKVFTAEDVSEFYGNEYQHLIPK